MIGQGVEMDAVLPFDAKIMMTKSNRSAAPALALAS
jgi:hypothetical protein